MIAAPEEHRWLMISRREVGEPGCGSYQSRPRWGILGVLFGWWRIRLLLGLSLPPRGSAPGLGGHTHS